MRHAKTSKTEPPLYLAAARRSRRPCPLASSIDSFLDKPLGRRGDAGVRKVAIARAILKAEHDSTLRPTPGKPPDFRSRSGIPGTPAFGKLLTRRTTKQTLKERLASVVFVVSTTTGASSNSSSSRLQHYWHVDANEAIDLMKHVKIYHPIRECRFASVARPLRPTSNTARSRRFGTLAPVCARDTHIHRANRGHYYSPLATFGGDRRSDSSDISGFSFQDEQHGSSEARAALATPVAPIRDHFATASGLSDKATAVT